MSISKSFKYLVLSAAIWLVLKKRGQKPIRNHRSEADQSPNFRYTYKSCPRRRFLLLHTWAPLVAILEVSLSSVEVWSFLSDKILYLLTTLSVHLPIGIGSCFYIYIFFFPFIIKDYKSMNRSTNRLNFSMTVCFFCSRLLPAPKIGIGGSTVVIAIPLSST